MRSGQSCETDPVVGLTVPSFRFTRWHVAESPAMIWLNHPLNPCRFTLYNLAESPVGLEADIVVEADDGRWAAFEVKLGDRWVEEGAATLRRVADRMKRGGRGAAAALAVIVPTGYGHVRPGEVGVIPIGTLGP